MTTGIAKRFSDRHGYGFLTVDGLSEDVFVHYSQIRMVGYKQLRPGDRCEFEVKRGPKGLYAVGCRRLTDAPAVRSSGTVKVFSDELRYGFIATPGVLEDVFVHASDVLGDDLRTYDNVEFELRKGPKGFYATNCRLSQVNAVRLAS